MKALLEIYRSVFSFWKIKGYYWWKHKLYRLCVRIPASVLLQISHKSEKITVTPQLSVMTSLSKFLDVVLFPLSGLVTGSSFITISWLFLVLWQFFFYRGLTRKPGMGNTTVWVFSRSGDCDELGTPNLGPMSLIKCYWMLQNARVTTFTVSELLKVH